MSAFRTSTTSYRKNDDKAAIFDGWCDFLNYFDSSISFQLCFLNVTTNGETSRDAIFIEKKDDAYDHIREEYAQMLRNQLSKGTNGLVKTKYLTFGIEADGI